MWIETKAVMENSHLQELTGKQSLVFIPYSFQLDEVIAYRPSLDEVGEPEPYTNIFFKSGENECVEIEYSKLNSLIMNQSLNNIL